MRDLHAARIGGARRCVAEGGPLHACCTYPTPRAAQSRSQQLNTRTAMRHPASLLRSSTQTPRAHRCSTRQRSHWVKVVVTGGVGPVRGGEAAMEKETERGAASWAAH
jgi:hypothetical protein